MSIKQRAVVPDALVVAQTHGDLDAESRAWWERLHAEDPIRGWAIAELYERLRREATFHVRKRAANVRRFPRSVGEVADTRQSAQDRLEWNELVQSIGRVMRDELTGQQRAVLTEIAINGTATATMAERLDSTPRHARCASARRSPSPRTSFSPPPAPAFPGSRQHGARSAARRVFSGTGVLLFTVEL
jgi:hypothetical protein